MSERRRHAPAGTPPNLPQLTRELGTGLRIVAPSAPPDLGDPLASPNALAIMTSSAMPYRAIIESMKPDVWESVEGTPFPASIVNEREGRGRLEYRPPQTDDLALAIPHEQLVALTAEMWERVASLSAREADTVTILASIWLERARSPKEVIRVGIDELIARSGRKHKKSGTGRRGGFEPEQRLGMITSLRHVAAIQHTYDTINVFEPNAKGEREKKKRHVTLGRAFLIFEPSGAMRLDGSLDIDSVRFVPGELLALFFWGPGRQTMQLDAKLLSFDPYRRGPEKALGYYLTGLWRMRSERESYADGLRVATLLERAGITLSVSDPGKTLKRLEGALNFLRDQGIITSWRYESWNLGETPARGWAPGWLDAKITMTPPAWLVTFYATEIDHKRAPAALPALTLSPLTGRLRETRARLNLTQAEAAEACDLPQQTYSRAERGAGVSAATHAKLEAWLAAHALPTQ